jgi:hypothetical protein
MPIVTATPAPTQDQTAPVPIPPLDAPEFTYTPAAETNHVPTMRFRNLVVSCRPTPKCLGNVQYAVCGMLALYFDLNARDGSIVEPPDIDLDQAEVCVTTDTGAKAWMAVHDDETAYHPALDAAIVEACTERLTRAQVDTALRQIERNLGL